MSLSSDQLKLLSLPLAGVVAGALLTLFGAWLSRRREDRKPLGRALAHLLEVHWFMFTYEIFRATGNATDAPIAKSLARALKFAMPAAMPRAEELEKSYAEAVDRVAEVMPVLAFELRGKVEIRSLYAKLGEKAGATDSPEGELANVLGDIAMRRALPAFEQIILQVARKFGWRTYFQVRGHFKELGRRRERAPAVAREQMAAGNPIVAVPQQTRQ